MSYIIAELPRLKGSEGIVQDGLFAEYRFDESFGDTLTDYTGNNNHGTLGAGINKPTRVSNGILFSENNYITLPNSVRDMLSIDKSFTVTIAGITTVNTILSSTISSTDRMAISVSIAIPKTIRGYMYKTERRCVASQTFEDSMSNIITYSADGIKGKMTVNNDSFRNGKIGLNPGATVGCRIGMNTTGTLPLEGTLYYMLFYSRVLTDSEVLRNYRVLKNILKLRGVIIG